MRSYISILWCVSKPLTIKTIFFILQYIVNEVLFTYYCLSLARLLTYRELAYRIREQNLFPLVYKKLIQILWLCRSWNLWRSLDTRPESTHLPTEPGTIQRDFISLLVHQDILLLGVNVLLATKVYHKLSLHLFIT